MITILKTPPKVSFCNNPILFGVSTNNMFASDGVTAKMVLQLTGPDETTGHGFTLSFNDHTLGFTLASSPDESGLQLMVASGGITLQEWGNLLVEGLRSNYHLVSNFHISGSYQGSYKITLESIEPSADYSLTLSDSTVTTLSVESNRQGATPVVRENFKIVGRVYIVNTPGELTFLAEEQITPDAEGKAQFDFAQYLLVEIADSSRFLFPQVISDFIFDRSDQIRRFVVQFCESYTGLYHRLQITWSTDTYVTVGGIDFAQMAKYIQEGSSYFDMLQYNKDFLTWRPQSKKIWIRQPEMLHFLIWYDDTSWLAQRIRITYSDNSTFTFTQYTYSPINKYDIVEVVCTYAKLDLISLPESQGKTIHKYEVWLEDNGVQVSRTMEFILDRTVYPNQRFFIFRNSLGGYDSIRCTGETIKQTDIARFTVERIIPDFSVMDPPRRQLFARETQKYSTNTGFITKLESEYLRDFFLSSEIYEFIENRLYPVMVLSTSLKVHKDNDYLYYREFEYARAYEDVNYAHDENIYTSKNFNQSFNTSYL
ncbi:MAG TPA: hypothetical protein PK711_10895 [Bacteroidales bacterium]|nr:hypothetical protein [Bacteroidales bacterium]